MDSEDSEIIIEQDNVLATAKRKHIKGEGDVMYGKLKTCT